jgi:hypothetical protein
MGIRSKIAILPAAVRTELDRLIVGRAFSEILTDRVSLLKLLLRPSNHSPKPRNQQKPTRAHLQTPRAHLKPSQTHLEPSQTRLNPLSRSSPHLTAFKPVSPRASGPHRVRHQLGLAHTGVPQAGGFPRPQRRTESSKTQPGAADEPAASPS